MAVTMDRPKGFDVVEVFRAVTQWRFGHVAPALSRRHNARSIVRLPEM